MDMTKPVQVLSIVMKYMDNAHNKSRTTQMRFEVLKDTGLSTSQIGTLLVLFSHAIHYGRFPSFHFIFKCFLSVSYSLMVYINLFHHILNSAKTLGFEGSSLRRMADFLVHLPTKPTPRISSLLCLGF